MHTRPPKPQRNRFQELTSGGTSLASTMKRACRNGPPGLSPSCRARRPTTVWRAQQHPLQGGGALSRHAVAARASARCVHHTDPEFPAEPLRLLPLLAEAWGSQRLQLADGPPCAPRPVLSSAPPSLSPFRQACSVSLGPTCRLALPYSMWLCHVILVTTTLFPAGGQRYTNPTAPDTRGHRKTAWKNIVQGAGGAWDTAPGQPW